ncbi:MAG: hypothetical protein ABIE84_02490 [bacterium]
MHFVWSIVIKTRNLNPSAWSLKHHQRTYFFNSWPRAKGVVSAATTVTTRGAVMSVDLADLAHPEPYQLDISRVTGRSANFWHWHYGLSGGDITGRQRSGSARNFIRQLISAGIENNPLQLNFVGRTDEQGLVYFPQEKELIALPSFRGRNDVDQGRDVLVVPHRFGQESFVLVYDKAGNFLQEVSFDPVLRGYYFDRIQKSPESREYVVALSSYGTGRRGVLGDYEFFYAGRDNFAPHAVLARFDKGLGLEAVFSLGRKLLPHSTLEENQVIFGEQCATKIGSAGKVPVTTVQREASSSQAKLYYFVFGGSDKYYFALVDVAKYALKSKYDVLGNEKPTKVRIEERNGIVVAAHVPLGRIPFVLISKWDPKTKSFILTASSRSQVVKKYYDGYCLLEQWPSRNQQAGEGISLSGKSKCLSVLPFDFEPQEMSALICNGEELLFYRDAPELTTQEQKVVRQIVMVREGLRVAKRDFAQAAEKAKEGAAIVAELEKNILEAESLEPAYRSYLAAFLLDSSELTDQAAPKYLAEAMRLRKLIMLRKRHLEQRESYLDFLNSNQSRWFVPNVALRLLAQFMGSDNHNSTSLSYFFEVFLGLAEGRYTKRGETIFSRALTWLPGIISERQPQFARAANLMKKSMAIMAADPGLKPLATYWQDFLSDPAQTKPLDFARLLEERPGRNIVRQPVVDSFLESESELVLRECQTLISGWRSMDRRSALARTLAVKTRLHPLVEAGAVSRMKYMEIIVLKRNLSRK